MKGSSKKAILLEAGLDLALLWNSEGVKVWIASLSLPPSALLTLRQILSSDERERADGYHLPQMRNAFTQRRGLLRILVAKELGCDPSRLRFTSNPFGKPVLTSGDACFSVSSSRDYAVWAFSPKISVGVDIEWIDPEMPLTALIQDHFSDREKKFLNEMEGVEERTDTFYRGWTGKEACAKAVGIGLFAPLNRYAVLDANGTVIDTSRGAFTVESFQIPPKPAKAVYWVSLARTTFKT